MNRTQAAEGTEKCCFLSLMTLTFDLYNLSDQGTKHVFPVDLAQIGSVVPKVFHKQKSHRQHQKQDLTQFTARGND